MGWIRAAIARAVHTDLADLEYVQRDPLVRESSARLIPGGLHGVARSLALYVLLASRELARLLRRARRPPANPVVFFSFTRTHADALSPLARHLPETYFTCANVYGRSVLNSDDRFDAEFPLGLAHLVALPFAPLLLWRWIRSRGWLREVFPRFLNVYWASYGMGIVGEWWLKRLGAKALVVANDHSTPTRILVRSARALGIPTFYVQHACVTERFPPLEFDHALLDGEDALTKYVTAGSRDVTIWLVGMSKLDGRKPVADVPGAIRAIGICTNIHDSLARTEELCGALRAAFPDLTIVLRPRPAGPIGPWQELARRAGVEWSRYESEPAAPFLARVDAVVGGDSSILLEAAILGVPPLYYDFSRRSLDWYGFVKRGLAEYASSTDTAVDIVDRWMREPPRVRERARYYCDTVGTAHEGRSGELGAGVIRNVVAGTSDPRWSRIEVPASLDVFRMRDELASVPHSPPFNRASTAS